MERTFLLNVMLALAENRLCGAHRYCSRGRFSTASTPTSIPGKLTTLPEALHSRLPGLEAARAWPHRGALTPIRLAWQWSGGAHAKNQIRSAMPNGSTGGSSNEQGSRHRSGTAAFLAVHAMVGKAVEGRPGAIPSRIYLEAAEHVDDIVVQMSDGAKWYLQCKRSAGIDVPLRRTLTQWCKQHYVPGDRLGLVSRKFRGALREIQPIIDQLNDTHSPPLNEWQIRDLGKVKSELQTAGCENPDALIPDALFLHLQTEFASDPHRQVACALLCTIVPPDKADSAFRALESLMQESAAAKRWTDMTDWLAALKVAHIEVRSDISGVPAAAAEARRQATEAYREVLARPLDLLTLSSLAPQLGEVRVDGLLEHWEVRWGDSRSADLLRVARRNARFILSGLPGIGKSEAMRQLAAHIASEAEAPVPVLFNVKESLAAIQSGGSLTLETILRHVSERIAGVDPAVATAALREALFSGNAVLMVDGLDEARSHLGTVAANLAQILTALPAATGFILSTRPSAEKATRQLSLPTVSLDSPPSLQRSLPQIIRTLLPNGVPRPEAWIEERVQRVRSASGHTDDIWKVPLLATFATLRIAADKDEATNAVELLSNVIDDSVTAWEHLKASHSDGLDPQMRPSMLTEGFITIGCLINTSTATVDGAETAVARQLEPWDLALPLRRELARQVVHFWDERVGVFVVDGDHLVARSRQFAELADARRASQLPLPEKQDWIVAALTNPDLRLTVQLAVQTDESLRTLLLEMADRSGDVGNRNRATEWVASFAPNWKGTPLELERRVLDVIANAAEDSRPVPEPGTAFIERIQARRSDGDGWHFAVQLARCQVAQALRDHQRGRLQQLSLAPQRRALIDLFVGLTEAKLEQRPLNDRELALLNGLLDSPRPERSSSDCRQGVFVIDAAERYIEGTSDVIELGVEHVDQLPEGANDKFFAIAKRHSHATFTKVASVLSERGYKVDYSALLPGLNRLREFSESFADKHGLGWLLSLLSDSPVESSKGVPPEPWRWGEISDLVSAIGWAEGSIGDLRAVAETSADLRATWIDKIVGVYSFDRGRLAAEARTILRQHEDKMDETLWQICTNQLIERQPLRQLDCEDAIELAVCFASHAESIVSLTAQLTVNTGCPGVSDVIETLDTPMTWRNRFLATTVSLATSTGDPALVERYRKGSSASRAGLALFVASVSDRPDLPLAELREDRDAAVRRYSGGNIEAAEIWTCEQCWTENALAGDSCEECHLHPGWLVRGKKN